MARMSSSSGQVPHVDPDVDRPGRRRGRDVLDQLQIDLVRTAPNLDGSSVETLLDTTTILAPSNVYAMTIDVPGGKLYWIESLNKTLYRANLDGSMVVPVASGGFFWGLAIAHPGPGITVTHRTGLATSEIGATDTIRVSQHTNHRDDDNPSTSATPPGGNC